MLIKCGIKTCGIYKITCTGNNQIYIGSSVDIYERWASHMSDLRLNKHHSRYLQRSFNKYGEASLVFEVIHEMYEHNEELLRLLEDYYIEELHPRFNSIAPMLCEFSQRWRENNSKALKALYKSGYINPRKGKGKKYNVYDLKGNILYNNITMDELSHKMEISYHTFNSMLRKYNGICCSIKNQCLIMEIERTFEDLLLLYKTSKFNMQCSICDLEGNLYPRCLYYKKSKPHKGKGITFRDIYKMIKKSEHLYIEIDDKVFTLPYLCRFIQQCISKTPEYPRNLSIARCMAT